jgi:RNA-directed DNA polymerase
MERMLDPNNLKRAWKQVRANRGASGVDGMTLAAFPDFVRMRWADIRQSLSDGTYRPQPVRRHTIPKPTGGERELGIPSVLDRVIQQAIAQVLTPIFDPDFSASSFGFRPGRSAHDAVRQVQGYIRAGYRYCVDLDLEQFFDRVDHDVLMARLARKVSDKRLLKRIGRYLRAGVSVEGTVHPTREGVPQGGPLSPLLSNIVLDELDKELERRGHRFARYADDVVILVKSRRAGERVMASITRFLERKLKLTVNRQKSRVVRTDEVEFLGFVFRRGKIRWSERSFERFKARVRRLTSRTWGVSMRYRLRELGRFLRGWMGYFALSEYYRPLPEIDQWIRRRVRMCYWKQWGRPRRRIGMLLRLGVNRREAITTGRSSLGPWTMARTPVTQQAMSNQWLKAQGLVSVRDLWIALNYRR